ncbi:MAG: hypothetical protein WAM28_05840 [Chlamydiales bacterium]
MRLSIAVIIAHLLIVSLFTYFYRPSSVAPLPKRAQIRTIVLKQPQPPLNTSPAQKREEKNVTHLSPPSKKKAAENPMPRTKKEPQKAKENSTNRKKLLALMQESLNDLESNQPEALSRPLPIGELASEQLNFEACYEEELASYLQRILKLPHRGTVTVQVILSREGKVQRVTILSTTDEENRHYITSTLPDLFLPPFGTQFKGEKEHTFLLTLTSMP